MADFKAINFKEKLAKFDDLWSPKVIAEMNDYQFKLVKVKDEFVWHKHDNTDEVFLVLDGQLTILFRDSKVELSAGEMFVVLKNTEHKPVAKEECHILLIEPKGLVNTGKVGGDKTAKNDIWV